MKDDLVIYNVYFPFPFAITFMDIIEWVGSFIFIFDNLINGKMIGALIVLDNVFGIGEDIQYWCWHDTYMKHSYY